MDGFQQAKDDANTVDCRVTRKVKFAKKGSDLAQNQTSKKPRSSSYIIITIPKYDRTKAICNNNNHSMQIGTKITISLLQSNATKDDDNYCNATTTQLLDVASLARL